MKTCYHPDAIDDHGFTSGNAWTFCDYVTSQLAKLELSVHAVTNVTVRIDGQRAFAESRYAVTHRIRNFLGFTDYLHQGRYLDLFELRDDWRIVRRMICQDGERWVSSPDLRLFTANSPNLPVQGSQGKADPSYAGFEFPALMRRRPTIADIWTPFRRAALVPIWLLRLLLVIPNLLWRSHSKANMSGDVHG